VHVVIARLTSFAHRPHCVFEIADRLTTKCTEIRRGGGAT
jgi:hypothetical protein